MPNNVKQEELPVHDSVIISAMISTRLFSVAEAEDYLARYVNQQVIQALEKIKQALPDTNDDNQFSPDGAGGWDLESYKLGIDDAVYEIDNLIKEYKGE